MYWKQLLSCLWIMNKHWTSDVLIIYPNKRKLVKYLEFPNIWKLEPGKQRTLRWKNASDQANNVPCVGRMPRTRQTTYLVLEECLGPGKQRTLCWKNASDQANNVPCVGRMPRTRQTIYLVLEECLGPGKQRTLRWKNASDKANNIPCVGRMPRTRQTTYLALEECLGLIVGGLDLSVVLLSHVRQGLSKTGLVLLRHPTVDLLDLNCRPRPRLIQLLTNNQSIINKRFRL